MLKPLSVAPLTPEDWAILVDHRGDAERAYAMGWRLAHSRDSDRRDADLMQRAQGCRSYTFPVDMPPLVLIGWSGAIDCGGALAEWKTLNITYFA